MRTLLLLTGFLGQSCAPAGQVLEVHISDLSGLSFVHLSSKLGDQPLAPREVTAEEAGSFLVRLPPELRGRFQLSVQGLDADRCQTAVEEAEVIVQLDGGPRRVDVALRRLQGRGCGIEVAHIGNPEGGDIELSKRAGEWMKLSCQPTCTFDLPPPGQIKLRARARPGFYFGGWSGICAGLGECPLTGENLPGGRRVRVAFYPNRACTSTGWCWENPLPQGAPSLSRVFALEERDVWAVGTLGTIMRYNGSSWARFPSGTQANLSGVWGVPAGEAPGDVFVVGEATILHTDGIGPMRPVSVSPPLDQNERLRAVWGSGPQDVWIGGERRIPEGQDYRFVGVLLRGDRNGFRRVDLGEAAPVQAIWGSGPRDVWLSGFHFDGDTFSPSPDASALWGSDGKHVWAIVPGGGLQLFNGIYWAKLGVFNDLYGVWGSGAEDVWVAGREGTLLRWDGRSFRSSSFRDQSATFFSLHGGSPHDIWAVGDRGRRLHWNGISWLGEDGGPTSELRAIAGNRNGQIWAVGSEFTLLRWDGDTLRPTDVGGDRRIPLNAVWVSDNGTVFVAGWLQNVLGVVEFDGKGAEDAKFKFTNDSANNETLKKTQVENLWGIDYRNTSNNAETVVYAVGPQRLLRRKPDGGEWTIEKETAGETYTAVWGWGAQSHHILLTGRRSNQGRLWWRDGMGKWTEIDKDAAGQPLPMLYNIWGSGPDDVWIVTSQGALYRYSAGGTLRQVALPAGFKARRVTLSTPGDVWLLESGSASGSARLARGNEREFTIIDTESPLSANSLYVGLEEAWVAGQAGMVIRRRLP